MSYKVYLIEATVAPMYPKKILAINQDGAMYFAVSKNNPEVIHFARQQDARRFITYLQTLPESKAHNFFPSEYLEPEGHGHVFPRPDGMKTRCGGPEICSECAWELQRKKLKIEDRGLQKECMGIINQLFDLAEVPVERRQKINDLADKYLEEQLTELVQIANTLAK